MNDWRWQNILVDVHNRIDQQAAMAQADIARRALGQRIRKLNRDMQNDQNTQ